MTNLRHFTTRPAYKVVMRLVPYNRVHSLPAYFGYRHQPKLAQEIKRAVERSAVNSRGLCMYPLVNFLNSSVPPRFSQSPPVSTVAAE